jgi:hypothetical protein
MKFKLILCSLLLALQFSAKATVIFSNGFEGDFIFYSGFETLANNCNDSNDNDNDGLLNCYETNTLFFINEFNTGTDPDDSDTDGDGISDGDEVLGTVNGLDLPAMGTNPLVRNILLEYDWFDDALECAAHSHRPTEQIINRVALTYLNAPNVNPDGSSGIVIIQDYGQGGVFNQGNLINDNDGVLAQGVSGAEFFSHKNNHFPSNRDGYFHYAILPHRYNVNSGSSGQAEVNGDDLIVSLYCFNTTTNVSNTIVHELGHNLSLRHGGNSNCNFKPNYNSVMNYQFQFPGADNNCDGAGNGVLDYSRGLNAPLNENQLVESNGICNGQAIDWNNSGAINASPVSFDINDDGAINNCFDDVSALNDNDDWAQVYFLGITDFDRNNAEVISCTNSPIQ